MPDVTVGDDAFALLTTALKPSLVHIQKEHNTFSVTDCLELEGRLNILLMF
jgi:hypothetical protein